MQVAMRAYWTIVATLATALVVGALMVKEDRSEQREHEERAARPRVSREAESVAGSPGPDAPCQVVEVEIVGGITPNVWCCTPGDSAGARSVWVSDAGGVTAVEARCPVTP